MIVDAAMRGMDGAETIRRLLDEMPDLRVIGHSGDVSNEEGLLAAGAATFVAKGTPVEDLVRAVRGEVAANR